MANIQENLDPSSPANHPILQDWIASGRLQTLPYRSATHAQPSVVNFDNLFTVLRRNALAVYNYWGDLSLKYSRTTAEITDLIEGDCEDMIHLLLQGLYNRLRQCCEFVNPALMVERMNNRAPVSPCFEFPSYFTRLINGIGWTRITDGPEDVILHWVNAPNTAKHYGRSASHLPSVDRYERLLNCLRRCGVTMSRIDYNPSGGKFWPTCSVIETDDKAFHVAGAFHFSHYTNDDAIFAITALEAGAHQPFEDVTLNIAKVTVNAVTDWLINNRPDDVIEGYNGDDPPRPVHGMFDVNRFGIGAAVGESPAYCYVIGRGLKPYYACYILKYALRNEIASLASYLMRS